MSASRVLVVGLGNDLMGDDGVGLEVVRRLAAAGPWPGVRIVEAGSDSLVLAELWAGEEEVWLVDALLGGAPPGTVRLLEHDELLALPQRHATAHHLSLPENLRWLALAHPGLASVRYRLWGVEPSRVEPVSGFSAEAAAGAAVLVRRLATALDDG